MSGGDLRFHITRKTFTEEAVRFWIAELGLALRYVHQQGIIHRDVKPDNILLDAEGHVHLADFVCSSVGLCCSALLTLSQNVASDFVPGKLLNSKSGTLAYLGPEVYKGTGYSWGADWWSLGVVFYECIYSKVCRGEDFVLHAHSSSAHSRPVRLPPWPRRFSRRNQPSP